MHDNPEKDYFHPHVYDSQTCAPFLTCAPKSITISFSETSKGWTCFSSYIQESGLSLNSGYYTFSDGHLWEHHINSTRNNFYGTQYNSHIELLFNDQPGIVKSFNTLNYEGSQARNTVDSNTPGGPFDAEYYNNFSKNGWYAEEIYTNLQNGTSLEFKNKEGKWFSKIKGEATQWEHTGSTIYTNIDPREFSFQGIGNSEKGACEGCPEVLWKCVPGTATIPAIPAIPGTPSIPAVPGTSYIPAIPASDSCETFTEINHGLGNPTQSQFLNWVSEPSNGYTNVSSQGYKVCLDHSYINQPSACLCGNGGVMMGAWTFGYNNTNGNSNFQIGGAGMDTWNNFIAALQATGDPVFKGVVNTMNRLQVEAKMQDNITSQSLDPCDYGQQSGSGCGFNGLNIGFNLCTCGAVVPAVPATTGSPAIPATPGSPAVPAIPGTPCECTSVTDGSGTYLTEFNCLEQCCEEEPSPTPVESWFCENGTCYDPGNGNGTYPTLAACQAICNPSPIESWNCDGNLCVDPGDGSGLYSSLALCQGACGPLSPCPPSNLSSTYYEQPYTGAVNIAFCNECAHAGPGSTMWINSPDCECCDVPIPPPPPAPVLCDLTWKPTIDNIVHDSGSCPSQSPNFNFSNFDGEMFASGTIPGWHSGDTWQWNVIVYPGATLTQWPLGGSGQFSTPNVNVHFQGPPGTAGNTIIGSNPPVANPWWEWVTYGSYMLVVTHYRNGGDNSPTGECTYTEEFTIECQLTSSRP